MFLLGLFIAFGSWVVSWSDHVKKELVVHVYFCTAADDRHGCTRDATQAQMDTVARTATSSPLVKNVDFISKEKALARERKKYPDEYKVLPANPLPDALTVVPRHGDDIDKVAALFSENPRAGVANIDYGKKTTHRVLKLAHVIEAFFIVAVVLLPAASTLLIANTIRLSIFARRREIEVMKLVGATILLILGREIALPALLHTGPLDAGSDVNALAFSLNALILIGMGLLLGAAGSGLTIRRFLRI